MKTLQEISEASHQTIQLSHYYNLSILALLFLLVLPVCYFGFRKKKNDEFEKQMEVTKRNIKFQMDMTTKAATIPLNVSRELDSKLADVKRQIQQEERRIKNEERNNNRNQQRPYDELPDSSKVRSSETDSSDDELFTSDEVESPVSPSESPSSKPALPLTNDEVDEILRQQQTIQPLVISETE